MIRHELACRCVICRSFTSDAVPVEQADLDLLATEWARWCSSTDGEADKMRRGETGNPGSPRWIALQAIARCRMARA